MKINKKTEQVFQMKRKEAYEAPVIEIIEIRVEQGFQISHDGLEDGPGDDEGSF